VSVLYFSYFRRCFTAHVLQVLLFNDTQPMVAVFGKSGLLLEQCATIYAHTDKLGIDAMSSSDYPIGRNQRTTATAQPHLPRPATGWRIAAAYDSC
jgi:hypothetical protein